eukprot:5694301-Alexandrium_andersonii.AAC.1
MAGAGAALCRTDRQRVLGVALPQAAEENAQDVGPGRSVATRSHNSRSSSARSGGMLQLSQPC